jgi:hypothetical protein
MNLQWIRFDGSKFPTLNFTMNISAPDLTKRPPRSPRVRLGGYVILPRALDKGRATLEGKNGEFHFNCPLDQQFLCFAGIDADALKAQIAQGKGDGEILEWIKQNSTPKRTDAEIMAWSNYQDQRGPGDLETREFFSKYHREMGPHRKDIFSWFDVLDLDDHVTFGGKA